MDILKQWWFWGIFGVVILMLLGGHKSEKNTTVQGAVNDIDKRLTNTDLTPSEITDLHIRRKALTDI